MSQHIDSMSLTSEQQLQPASSTATIDLGISHFDPNGSYINRKRWQAPTHEQLLALVSQCESSPPSYINLSWCYIKDDLCQRIFQPQAARCCLVYLDLSRRLPFTYACTMHPLQLCVPDAPPSFSDAASARQAAPLSPPPSPAAALWCTST